MKEEEIISFERKDFDDEDGTVVSFLYQIPLWDMPLFVILDNSIYNCSSFSLRPLANTKKWNALDALINRSNTTYKNYKLYDSRQDSPILGLRIYVSDDAFEPALMYALMSSIIDYIPRICSESKLPLKVVLTNQ